MPDGKHLNLLIFPAYSTQQVTTTQQSVSNKYTGLIHNNFHTSGTNELKYLALDNMNANLRF